MNGYNGKILRVNLSHSSISVDEPDESFYRRYLGGTGFISYFLLKEVPRGADPLGAENRLIFATGPVTGAPVIGSGRNSIGAKSPLTNLFGTGQVGGYWGAELKHAGYDAIIIEGMAENPVYLWIKDGQVEIRDASHLWGMTTGDCEKTIKQELGDRNIRIAQIGAGGENLVRYACVINDLRDACGRGGIGAVMGSKKLKAIAVRGHQNVALADAETISAIAKWFRDNFKNIKSLANMSAHGTAGSLSSFNRIGTLPTRNFQEGVFEGASQISGEAIESGALQERRGCYACPIQCKAVVSVGERYNVDPIYGGPEYETQAALGSLCGVADLGAMLKGNELCNAYGLDSISTGVTIAFAMECFKRGILTEKDTGGLALNFGHAEAMLQMIEMIARREGFGQVLAEGSARAAQAIGRGAEEFAMHVKKQEIPMHDPRLKQGMGLGYTIHPTGADHNDNIHDTDFETKISHKLNSLGIFEPLPLNDLGPAKVRLLHYGATWQHLLNCLVVCNFITFTTRQVVDLVRAATGWPTSVFELMKTSERCIQMTRAFNIREGMSADEDRLPERFFTPFPSGPLQGVKIEKETLVKARNIYYDMVGWDKESGAPTRGKLQELGIEWVAEV
ncbi:aldehyde ferredoxin oxidoreductase family protein [Chloroflexota bacterium]